MGGWWAIRDAVVAVGACDLLDQVGLDVEVEAIARRGHAPAIVAVIEFHAQAQQGVAHHVYRYLHAQYARQATAPQCDRGALCDGRTGLDQRAGSATDDVQQQRGSALDRASLERRVDTPLEAIG